MNRRTLSAVLTLLIASIPSLAQVAGIDSPVCNAKFAEILVEGQVMESKSVVEPVKRIKILIRAAEFLWKHDPPTARAYLAEAWKIANDRFKEIGFEKKDHARGTYQQLPDQRMEVIRSIAKLDSEWAKKLSEQMLADYDKSKAERKGDETRELGELLRLAQASAKSNPELSRYLFRRVMKYPLYNHWFFNFHRLATDQIPFADSLYAEALTAYAKESPRRMLYLSAYPFASERIMGYEKFNLGSGKPETLAPNPTFERRFLNMFFDRIAQFAASEEEMNKPVEKYDVPEAVYMVSGLRDIEPLVIERHPDLLNRLGIAKSQAASLLTDAGRKQIDEKEKYNQKLGGTFDDRLADVKKADGEGKLTDYMILNLLTWGEKTEEQFEEVESWLAKVKDEKVRRELTEYFWYLRSKLAINEKRFEDAEKYALKVPSMDLRALLGFDIATIHAKNETDTSALFDTLNRLSKLARTADNSVAKAQVLLGLANMYERVNHSVALDELGEAIRVTNGLKDPDIFASSFYRSIQGKDFGFMAGFSTPGYDLEKTFEELSKRDFEMSLTNAKTLDDKYFRTIAVIAVANNCAKNSKPAPKVKAKN